jgi:transposase InsO family protein
VASQPERSIEHLVHTCRCSTTPHDQVVQHKPTPAPRRWGHWKPDRTDTAGLRLRHDHGSQYVSHDFQAEIRFLGIESSPAFVREPEGNGCACPPAREAGPGAERFIRVLKESLSWVRRFDTVEELRLALLAFRQTYNQSWIIERRGYRTPVQVRAEQTTALPMAA